MSSWNPNWYSAETISPRSVVMAGSSWGGCIPVHGRWTLRWSALRVRRSSSEFGRWDAAGASSSRAPLVRSPAEFRPELSDIRVRPSNERGAARAGSSCVAWRRVRVTRSGPAATRRLPGNRPRGGRTPPSP